MQYLGVKNCASAIPLHKSITPACHQFRCDHNLPLCAQKGNILMTVLQNGLEYLNFKSNLLQLICNVVPWWPHFWIQLVLSFHMHHSLLFVRKIWRLKTIYYLELKSYHCHQFSTWNTEMSLVLTSLNILTDKFDLECGKMGNK